VPATSTISESTTTTGHYVHCNLCGADDYTVVFPKGYAQLHRIVRCNHCGLMYSNPQELIDCERFVTDPQPFIEDWNGQYLRKQIVQIPDNLRALRVLNELAPQRGQLLEIGSFCGIFLDRIRAEGWDVTGLEPDAAVADYSRRRYNLNIVGGILPNPAFADKSFDAVMMLHVIEHMPDPSENLREIHRILKPGGFLVVETPRFDSMMFKLLGRHERSIQNCNGHIYFFTVPSLKKMFEKNGFQVEKVEFVGRTLTLDRFIWNLGLMTRSPRIQRWLASLSAKWHLHKRSFYVNVHDMQRHYVRAI
jgi:SAM-dependent methyltransferase